MVAADPVAEVLVPLGTPATVVLAPRALLMMLPMMPLAPADGSGRGMAIRVVLVLGTGGSDVTRPTGIPEGPVGTKLAGVVAASGSEVTTAGCVVTTSG